MGSLERCPTCGGAMVNDYCQLEDGDIVPDNYCINCGRRPKVTPKCTEPSCAEPPHAVAPPPKKQKPKPNRNRPNQRGRCVNCGRKEIHIAAYGQCDYCYYSVDKVEAAWKAVNGWARRTALKMHPDIRERFVKKHYGGSRALPEVRV